jgi:carbon storage regulator
MLVLSRKVGERIQIGDHIVLTVVKLNGSAVRLGIDAPAKMVVVREELTRGATSAANSAATGAESKEPAGTIG